RSGMVLPMKTLLVGLITMGGCAAFTTVRSAEVTPGPAVTTQASMAGRPGDDAAWFFSFDCAASCDHAIMSTDIAFAYGMNVGSTIPFTFGGGLNGTFPYFEGYAQLGRGKIPFGIGARGGVPTGWAMDQLYGRLDVPLSASARLLW